MELVNNLGFYLLLLVIILLGHVSISSFDHWKKRNIPFVPPWPFFGNMERLVLHLETVVQTMDRIYNTFKNQKVVGFFMMKQPVLMVIDPELANDICVKNFTSFYDHWSPVYFPNKKLNPILTSIFFALGERWSILRHKLSPGFSIGKLRSMFDQIKYCTDELITLIDRKIVKSNEIDVCDLSHNVTIDIIGACALGIDCEALKDSHSDIRKYVDQLMQPRMMDFVRILLHSLSSKLPFLLKVTDFPTSANNFFLRLLEKSVSSRKVNKIRRNDLFQQLIDLQNTKYNCNDYTYFGEPKRVLNDKFDEVDIFANAMIILMAGSETSSSTIAFCLHELVLNQKIQEKVRNEINSVKKVHEGEITVDSLKELNYLGMVIAETLRKHPPTYAIPRVCTQDYRIPDSNILIRKGDNLLIPVSAIHHDPKYYQNPCDFNPERFSKENKVCRPSGTYIPFGEGPKYCIGKGFAEMEMKLILAELIGKYKFASCRKTEMSVKLKVGAGLVKPQNGIWLKITKIND